MENTVETPIDENSILPNVPELFVEQRQDRFLLLNVRGPQWCVGTKPVAIFVELCDGSRSLGDIVRLMKPHFRNLTTENMISITKSLLDADFFCEGIKFPFAGLSNVAFNLTKRCNLQCPFCYYDSSPTASIEDELDTSEWISIAQKISQLNPNSVIYFMGGEPMIRHDIVELVKGVSACGLRTVLITNGTLFKTSTIDTLAMIPRLRVQVSLDSILPNENSQMRGPKHLKKCKLAIRRMIDASLRVKVSSTLTQVNKKSIWRVRSYCDSLGIDWRTSVFFVGGGRSMESQKESGLNADELLDSMIYNGKHIHTSLYRRSVNQPKPGFIRYGCGIGYGSIAINPNGAVSPCNHLTDSSLYIGNVREEDLYTIIERGFSKYRTIDVDCMPKTGCGGCHLRYLCGGGCKANSHHAYNTMNVPPPECAFLKQAFMDYLWTDIMGTTFSRIVPNEFKH